MIELARIVEQQANLSSYRATQNKERAQQLELLFESTKPKNHYPDWHPLIATPFRYAPPLKQARFCPPYGKNIFYGALVKETALYEHAYYFMKERILLKKLKTQTGTRTLFTVDTDDSGAYNIRHAKMRALIMNKNDYSASHQFMTENPGTTFILYPSCRDPEERDNAAVLDIHRLQKLPKWQTALNFFYDNKKKQLTWINYALTIKWTEVA